MWQLSLIWNLVNIKTIPAPTLPSPPPLYSPPPLTPPLPPPPPPPPPSVGSFLLFISSVHCLLLFNFSHSSSMKSLLFMNRGFFSGKRASMKTDEDDLLCFSFLLMLLCRLNWVHRVNLSSLGRLLACFFEQLPPIRSFIMMRHNLLLLIESKANRRKWNWLFVSCSKCWKQTIENVEPWRIQF